MIRRIQQGLIAEGVVVSVAKLCAWFGIPRRTVYYKPVKAAPKVEARFCEPIKTLIEEEPSLGYRTVAWLLGVNKNTVQRIFQIKGWPLSAACCACACRATGAQACRGHAAPYPGRAVGCGCAERALVDGSHPYLDGHGRPGFPGVRR